MGHEMRERYTMSVSPDFPPKGIPGWYIFNTWLQNQLGIPIHLALFDSFEEQRAAIDAGKLDLIYANPFDASALIRKQGFKAISAPIGRPDEALIAVNKESAFRVIEDLPSSISVACTDEPEVNLIGNILVEPADIEPDRITVKQVDSYVLVAKALLKNEVTAGYFLKSAYDEFSSFITDQLRVLISSEIQLIRHVMLAGPRLSDFHDDLGRCLINMAHEEKGRGVLHSMDLSGWESLSQEDTEFMIDLMETLQP